MSLGVILCAEIRTFTARTGAEGFCRGKPGDQTKNNMAASSNPSAQKFILEELEDVRRKILEKVEGSELISCHPAAVNVRIT